jgi:hypothetical protein
VALTGVGVTAPGSSTSQILTAKSYSLEVFLDSGTTLSIIPQNLFNAILAFFPGAAPASSGSTTYTVPCNYTTMGGTVDFNFGGVVVNIPYSEFIWQTSTVCYLGVVAGSDGILGDTFLRGVYGKSSLSKQQRGYHARN